VNVVDSSAWLEYFADGPNAGFFAPAVEDVAALLVPTVVLLEVFKRLYQQVGESAALMAVAQMQQGRVVDLDAAMALTAARLGLEQRLPLADSVVYAAAKHHDATLWTQDGDFEGKPKVKFRAKRGGGG
jgi:predicted nucleic acid-binding protein